MTLPRRQASSCSGYSSALTVTVPEGRYVIEMAPVIDADGCRRGVVAEGPVGTTLAGRLRVFRYEIRRWRGGVIPDAGDAPGWDAGIVVAARMRPGPCDTGGERQRPRTCTRTQKPPVLSLR